jgi:hypothetical protein
MHNGTTNLPILELPLLSTVRQEQGRPYLKILKDDQNSLSFALFSFSNSLNEDECYNSSTYVRAFGKHIAHLKRSSLMP